MDKITSDVGVADRWGNNGFDMLSCILSPSYNGKMVIAVDGDGSFNMTFTLLKVNRCEQKPQSSILSGR
jgi:hypothetical protein